MIEQKMIDAAAEYISQHQDLEEAPINQIVRRAYAVLDAREAGRA